MPDLSFQHDFSMHGARSVLASKAVFIEKQLDAIERAVIENPALAFDLARSLIESACKTILNDRACSIDVRWSLPRLFSETLTQLKLIPTSHTDRGDVSQTLQKIVNGLQTTVFGLCELRNKEGFASHGKDGYLIMMDSVQAELAARSADAVVCFLFQSHRAYDWIEPAERLEYDTNHNFNNYVDSSHEIIKIFDSEYLPSEVLFRIDHVAYREYFVEFIDSENIIENTDGGHKT